MPRLFFAAALLAFGVSAAHAQKQEQTMLDRIKNPDMTLKFDPADKQFSAGSAISNKTAAGKPFAFSKSAYVRDGFHTEGFSGAKSFGTKDYASKEASIARRTFGQAAHPYGTRDFTVRDAMEANKTVAVKTYNNPKLQEPYVPHGKSQGTIDTLMADKNLDIDQVRELLNKNK